MPTRATCDQLSLSQKIVYTGNALVAIALLVPSSFLLSWPLGRALIRKEVRFVCWLRHRGGNPTKHMKKQKQCGVHRSWGAEGTPHRANRKRDLQLNQQVGRKKQRNRVRDLGPGHCPTRFPMRSPNWWLGSKQTQVPESHCD